MHFFSYTVAWFSIIQNAISWQHIFSESDIASCHESCFTTTIGAFDTVKTPIWFSSNPLDPAERSKMSAVNGTAFEQWVFESVSESGDAFLVAFGRDPSYKPFGYGVLPMEMMFLFRNGTRVPLTAFAQESSVVDCCGEVFGQWKFADGKGSASWRVSADLKSARVDLNTLNIQGSAFWESTTPTRYPDGSLWPSKTARTEIAPHMHVIEPIPMAKVSANFQVHGSPLTFTGIGGHMHDWLAFDWFKVLDSWEMIRGKVGPYAFTMLNPTSRINSGVLYQSAMLFKDGNPIFTAARQSPTVNTRNRVRVEREYSGDVRGSFVDDSTGWRIHFIAPELGQHWSFVTEHNRIAHEQGLGGGTGLTVFADAIVGGEVDGEQYKGYGICEQVVLPPRVDLRTTWRLFQIHRDNSGLSTLGALWRIVRTALTEAGKHAAWILC